MSLAAIRAKASKNHRQQLKSSFAVPLHHKKGQWSFLGCAALCFLLSGCVRQSKVLIQNKPISACDGSDFDVKEDLKVDRDVVLCEVALAEIPQPLSSRPLAECFAYNDSDTDKTVIGAYESCLSVNDLATFYVQQMEYFGWFLGASFIGREQLFQFERPGKLCIISLRPVQDRTHVYLFHGLKFER